MEVAKARPITGLIFGLVFGLALAVLIQQAGLWPLDKLTVFLLPALTALAFILLAGIGRRSAPGALTVALILLIAPLAYGLTGIGEFGDRGVLNGGCAVEAASDVDTTVVTDTSRSSPFDVEPDGGLSWVASSPGPITDHQWQVWVVIGGFDYVIAEGAETNSDLDVDSVGEEPSVGGIIDDLSGVPGFQITGVYEVGGSIDGEGGACDGLAFVRIRGPLLGSVVGWTALVVAVLSLAIFLLIAFTGRKRPIAVVDGDGVDTAVGVATVTTGPLATGATDEEEAAADLSPDSPDDA